MKAFRTQADWRAWLQRNHAAKAELELRLFKTHARQRGIGYKEALDEALCFGWIDGVRHALDDDSFVQRFTPRRPRSNWSAVNVKRFRELDAAGLVRAAGRAAFDAWNGRKAPYSFENRDVTLAPELVTALRSNRKAWAYWERMPPGYRRLTTHWVMSAKRAETRASRFAVALACSARGELIPGLRRNK